MAKKKTARFSPPKKKPQVPSGWSMPHAGQPGWNPTGSYAKPITPGVPAAPGAPATTGQPYEPYRQAQEAYTRDLEGLTAFYGTGSATDPYDKRYGNLGTQLRSDYGFREKQGGGYEIDPSNPYSRAAGLQRSYEQGQRGTSTSMAARGQLYSGALQSALDHGTRQYGEASHGLQSAFSRSLGELDLQRMDRRSGLEASMRDAERGRADFYAVTPSAAPQPAQPSQPAPAPVYHPVVQQTMNQARSLWNSGKRAGPKWREVISILGYDPRQGGGLNFR